MIPKNSDRKRCFKETVSFFRRRQHEQKGHYHDKAEGIKAVICNSQRGEIT